MNNTNEDIQIHQGEAAKNHLRPEDLRRLSLNLAKATADIPTSTIGKTRMLVRELLTINHPATNQLIDPTKEKNMRDHMLDRMWFRRGPRERAVVTQEHAEHMRDKGEMLAITVDGKTAGMSGFLKVGNHPVDGKEMYELGRLSVLRRFQRKGLSPRLLDATKSAIWRENPNAYIILHTTHDAVKKWCDNQNAKRFSPEEEAQFFGYILSEKELRHMQEYKWMMYLIPPPSTKNMSNNKEPFGST